MRKTAPQVFHDKENEPTNFILIPTDLFVAINNLCNSSEQKILFTLLGCKGDGSFSPSLQYMLKMTGITQPNNYYRARKDLELKGHIETDEQGNIHIDTQNILNKYLYDTHNK